MIRKKIRNNIILDKIIKRDFSIFHELQNISDFKISHIIF